MSLPGEGNGNPLQYSCLENPRDRGAWLVPVYGAAQSWTRLKRLSSSSSRIYYAFLFIFCLFFVFHSFVHLFLFSWGYLNIFSAFYFDVFKVGLEMCLSLKFFAVVAIGIAVNIECIYMCQHFTSFRMLFFSPMWYSCLKYYLFVLEP